MGLIAVLLSPHPVEATVKSVVTICLFGLDGSLPLARIH